MIRFLFILIFVSISQIAITQEKVVSDSLSVRSHERNIQQFLIGKPLLSESSFLPLADLSFNLSVLKQPLLPDYNKLLDFKNALDFRSVVINRPMALGYGFLPFAASGSIFNQAAYKINDRVIFGGASFGARSVFDQLNLNPAIQNMSTKGASMFMQYKVSKNFKIETRVTISNHRSPWEP